MSSKVNRKNYSGASRCIFDMNIAEGRGIVYSKLWLPKRSLFLLSKILPDLLRIHANDFFGYLLFDCSKCLHRTKLSVFLQHSLSFFQRPMYQQFLREVMFFQESFRFFCLLHKKWIIAIVLYFVANKWSWIWPLFALNS